MMSKIISLIISGAVLVLLLFFPIYIFPLGSYTGTQKVIGGEVTYSVSFGVNGVYVQSEPIEGTGKYLIEDGKMYTSIGETEVVKIAPTYNVENWFTISIGSGDSKIVMTNIVGIIVTGLFALFFVFDFLALIFGLFRRKGRN